MTRKVEAWLARLSDPAGPNARWTPPPFKISESASLDALVDEASHHNVRPVVVRNLGASLRAAPQAVLTGDAGRARQIVEAVMAKANAARLQDLGRSVLLAEAAREILTKVIEQTLPAAQVKGVDFAENAYGGLHNRTFSDIDLLVRPDAEPALADVLTELGYRAIDPRQGRDDYTERQWTRRDAHGGANLVEVHTDLVHAPELRARQTLTYDLYATPEVGGITPAARMVLAGLHGATSHLFGRLQYVVDGLMIARSGVDGQELRERARRSNATLAVATMLRLTEAIYGCPSSAGLLAALDKPPFGSFERLLITPDMVVSAKSRHRWRHLPRRYAYRWLMQRQA
jgi:hypothetical protein